MSDHFEVIVLGGGPGGYAAAGRAAQLGLTAAVIERDRLGGVCLNWGCIPTKALLESAHAFETLKNATKYGLVCDAPRFDFPAIIKRSRQIADRMSKGVNFLMKQRGVTVINGAGRLVSPNQIDVTSEDDTRQLSADHIVLATGGSPICLPGSQFDGVHILHSTHAMTLDYPPESLLIIGAGAIGMEFADFYRTFGTDITVVEMLPTVLPLEDEEIVHELSRTLRRKKIKTHVNTRVSSIETVDGRVCVTAEGPKGEITLEAEKLLMAVGVRPNSGNIGLETAGVETDRGFVKVDERMRTTAPGVYAIGDLAGPPLLAHKASMEAICCINGIADHPSFQPVDYANMPACTYCKPQVASVGLTEKAAEEKGFTVEKGVFPFRANGRSIAMNETEGIVKLVFNSHDGRLLGAHILHAQASELLAELGLGMTKKVRHRDIAETIHAHPTLSEAVMEAAAAVLGEAIHI